MKFRRLSKTELLEDKKHLFSTNFFTLNSLPSLSYQILILYSINVYPLLGGFRFRLRYQIVFINGRG